MVMMVMLIDKMPKRFSVIHRSCCTPMLSFAFSSVKIGYISLFIMLLLFNNTGMAMIKVAESSFIVTATIVLPTCKIVVQTDSANGNRLDFGVYDKSLGLAPEPINFSLVAFEVGSSIPGCSAFMAAPKTVISFGNPGQLDELGVVTKGAGDEVHILIRARDSEASYKRNINVDQNVVEYPASFAAKGRFDFEARPIRINKASAGEYSGSLSFVVSYQ